MRGRMSWAFFLAAALALMAASGCGDGGADEPAAGTPEAAPRDLTVVATTAPIAALAREVAGERAQVRGIMAAGVDPHEFEPTAGDLAALNNADIIFRHGVGLDDFVEGGLVRVTGAPVVVVTRDIGDHFGALGGDETDPHVWLDPILAKVMVENIRDALAKVDPGGAELYAAGAAAYSARLDEVDAQVREILSAVPVQDRKIVTDHDGFGYFARRYQITIVGAVVPGVSTQSEPSAQGVASLLDTIREEGVKAIFVASGTRSDVADQIARDAGIKVVEGLYVDSLGGPGSGAETLDGMLLANARLIAEALR